MNNDQRSFALFIPHAGFPPRWAGGFICGHSVQGLTCNVAASYNLYSFASFSKFPYNVLAQKSFSSPSDQSNIQRLSSFNGDTRFLFVQIFPPRYCLRLFTTAVRESWNKIKNGCAVRFDNFCTRNGAISVIFPREFFSLCELLCVSICPLAARYCLLATL